jgi:hypothetical protein
LDAIRYTFVAPNGTVSFVADCRFLPAVISACIENAGSLSEVLDIVARRNKQLKQYVTTGLLVFEEHNTPDDHSWIDNQIAAKPSRELPVFRVLSDTTREASLRPAHAGVIVFNLVARRIVQLQNAYVDIGDFVGARSRLERSGWSITP